MSSLLGGGGGSGSSRQAAVGEEIVQQKALKYLQQQNKITDQLRNAAGTELGSIYGLPGFASGGDEKLLEQAENSPIYKAMLDQINQGLVLQQNQTGSSAAAKGLLGSGTMADALARQQAMAGVSRAGALSGVYQNMLGGLTGMSQQPTNANSIAQMMQNIGNTYAQGILGSAQSGAAGQQAGLGNLMGLAGTAMQAYKTFG